MLETPINVYDFLVDGYASSRISSVQAGFLLRLASRLDYESMPADHCDAGPRERGLIEQDPPAQALLESTWTTLLDQDLPQLAHHYRAGPKPSVITVLKLGSGYSLDWHNHLSTGCTATLLVYLFDREDDSGRGGDLVLGQLGPDLETPRETGRFSIQHGDAILIGDASHPLLMHKAERWDGRGSRYLISFAFNALDW